MFVYFLLMSIDCVGMSPLLFLIISNLCSLFFLSLAKGLLILLFFSQKQFWFHWFFSVNVLFSISLIYALIFIISILLFTLNLICSFSSFMKWKLSRLIFLFSQYVHSVLQISKQCFHCNSQILSCIIIFIQFKMFFNFPRDFFDALLFRHFNVQSRHLIQSFSGGSLKCFGIFQPSSCLISSLISVWSESRCLIYIPLIS